MCSCGIFPGVLFPGLEMISSGGVIGSPAHCMEAVGSVRGRVFRGRVMKGLQTAAIAHAHRGWLVASPGAFRARVGHRLQLMQGLVAEAGSQTFAKLRPGQGRVRAFIEKIG